MVDVGDDGDVASFFDHDVVSIDDSEAVADGSVPWFVNSGLRAVRLVGEGGGGCCHQAWPFNAGDRREHWHALAKQMVGMQAAS